MPNWSDLPAELKARILTKTDRKGRHSHRLTSRTEKEEIQRMMPDVLDDDIRYIRKQAPRKAIGIITKQGFRNALNHQHSRHTLTDMPVGQNGRRLVLARKDRAHLPQEQQGAEFITNPNVFRKYTGDDKGNHFTWEQIYCPECRQVAEATFKTEKDREFPADYDSDDSELFVPNVTEAIKYNACPHRPGPITVLNYENTDPVNPWFLRKLQMDQEGTRTLEVSRYDPWPEQVPEETALSEAVRLAQDKPVQDANARIGHAARGKRPAKRWANAVRAARQKLNVTGFVPVKKGTKLYREAKRQMK